MLAGKLPWNHSGRIMRSKSMLGGDNRRQSLNIVMLGRLQSNVANHTTWAFSHYAWVSSWPMYRFITNLSLVKIWANWLIFPFLSEPTDNGEEIVHCLLRRLNVYDNPSAAKRQRLRKLTGSAVNVVEIYADRRGIVEKLNEGVSEIEKSWAEGQPCKSLRDWWFLRLFPLVLAQGVGLGYVPRAITSSYGSGHTRHILQEFQFASCPLRKASLACERRLWILLDRPDRIQLERLWLKVLVL